MSPAISPAISTDTNQPISQLLADFALRLQWEQVPAAVQKRATYLILDAVGVAFASTRYDFAHRTCTALSGLSGGGDSVVIGMPIRLPVRDAALLNGVLVHGLDFDDTHVAGVIHLTTTALPCALAAAMHTGASGQDLLLAYLIGMEVGARLGAVAKGAFHQVGHHPTGVIGHFSCSLLAGRLLGLTRQQLRHVQGIALSTTSGSMEFLQDGAWTKRLHPGWAAASGITNASLAKQGFTGPGLPYEGRFGLYHSLLVNEEARCDYRLATADLTQVWETMNVAVKPYPACHFTHSCADAANLLATRHNLQPEQIRSIRALVPEQVVKTVCEPEQNKQKPANSYEAQFSIPYLIAASIVKRRFTLQELEAETLSDPDILAVAAKVKYEIDPQAGFPTYYSGEVIITTMDGKEYRHREFKNRGCFDRPLSNQEITDKFFDNATTAISPARAERVREAILHLATQPDLGELGQALQG